VSATASGASGNGASDGAAISADGRFVAFYSTASDLAAGDVNGSSSDIFRRDLLTGVTTLVSATATGTSGDATSFNPSISADGRYVAFESLAGDLVSGDGDGEYDVFVRDVRTGVTSLVSATPAGVSGNSYSFKALISPNGRYVAFQSYANDLVSGITPGPFQVHVYLRNLRTGVTTLVDATRAGSPGNGGSAHTSISADGRTVAFYSDASDLVANDSNGRSDVFVRNLDTGRTTLVSVAASRGSGNGGSFAPSMSRDGRFVTFQSDASNLASQESNGHVNVFVRDLLLKKTTLVSKTPGASGGNDNSFNPVISGAGAAVVFQSGASDLVMDDYNGHLDLFAYDLARDATSLVSRRHGELPSATAGGSTSLGRDSLSDDGRYVAFESFAANLVKGDGNVASDIFVRDLQTGAVTLVSATPAGASGNQASSQAALSGNGRFVAFQSYASDLVSGDVGTFSDIFVRDLLTGKTALVSASRTGKSANGDSFNPVVSADGRFVAYQSTASNLVYNDNNGQIDVFVRDVQNGKTYLVSRTTTGASGNGASFNPVMTPDGGHVAFESHASDLVAGDNNGRMDVFVRNVQAWKTHLASSTPAGASGDGNSFSPVISDSGRYVAFSSAASDLTANDGNGVIDVFWRDLRTGTTRLVSTTPAGLAGNGPSFDPVISADGRTVAFLSIASDLAADDLNETYDVFVRDMVSGLTSLVSKTILGGSGAGGSFSPTMSADGRYVAFESNADDLAAQDDNRGSDVFVRDLKTGVTTLVSATRRGISGDGSSYNAEVSADGHTIAFVSSATDLVLRDFNFFQDAFVFRNKTS
jgi:Tol biopolymer transport system component